MTVEDEEQHVPINGSPVHALPVGAVAEQLEVGRREGLSEQVVRERRARHGENRLRETEKRSVLRILLDQFQSTVIIVLLVAAGLAVAAQHWTESVAIGAVLLVNAAIGFVSEWRARRSMQALRDLARHEVRVRRDGQEKIVPVEELVPGDIFLFEAGDLIPADARILVAEGARANEAALTGESAAVDKTSDAIDAEAPLAERSNMLHRGTTIASGHGEAVVCAIGGATELGRIAELAEEAEATQTPLEQRLDHLGRRLAVLTLVVAAGIAALGVASGRPTVLMVETAIALGVAAIPEGLPIVTTVALARGMWLLARRQALINRLAAVETLGATRVIFSDKTGTLTENRMELRRIVTSSADVDLADDPPDEPQGLVRRALEIGVLCNGASIDSNADSSGDADEDSDRTEGDPTEVALLRAGAQLGLDREALLEQKPQLREVPFDSDVMMMATFHRADDRIEVAVKGAIEALLEACDRTAIDEGESEQLDEQGRERWRERANELASEGLRVLAVADKEAAGEDETPYDGLRLVGLVGLLDPPREGVREAIEACRSAGIRVRVVTGDQAETARAIAREVGLAGHGKAHGHGEHGEEGELAVLEGSELPVDDGSPDDALRHRILETDVFARLSPKQKLDLVGVYQDEGEVVAMTGDGVNDAPALKKADIGIAMGRRGTDAARQVSDMVLRNDAFSSIVAAVAQGRIIFDDIRKATIFMLCTNGAEILAVAIASLSAMPLPIRPLQILYLNVLTDVFPALALAVGAGTSAVMQRPPRPREESVLTRAHWLEIGAFSVVIGACVLGALLVADGRMGLESHAAVTVSFLTLGLAKLWFVFGLRDPQSRFFDNEIVRNGWIWASIALCMVLLMAALYAPGLSGILETRALGLPALGLALAMSLVPMLLAQVVLEIRRRRFQQAVEQRK